MELLSLDLAAKLPAGDGRDEPNINPFLEEPASRFDFSCRSLLRQPGTFIYHLLGPTAIYRMIIAGLITLISGLLTYWWPSLVTMTQQAAT